MIQLKDLGTFESVPHIVTDIVTGKKIANIIPLCAAHHLQIHNKQRNLNKSKKQKFKNVERW